jgi:hypothetical protein
MSYVSFCVKVLLVSALISVGIKYVAPGLAIPATNGVSLLLVLLPPLGVGGFLTWHFFKTQKR